MSKIRKLGKHVRKPGWCRWSATCLCAGIVTFNSAGCTRNYYRNRADQEVACVLREKDQYPAWRIEQFHVYPDPRARFADPTNPDKPPMPPDDPAARCLSPTPQHPYKKSGTGWVEGEGYLHVLAQWDAANRAAAKQDEKDEAKDKVVQVADTQPAPPPDPPPSSSDSVCPPDHPFLINLEQSVELGLFNSREYQDRRENLYLVSLPVTKERYAFSTQFFAAGQAIRERSGLETPDPGNRWSTSGNVGFSKLFSTGALLLFNVANQTVFEFGSSARDVVSTSTLSLDLFQPLLYGGGRAVTLEPLTQVERNLLYEIRTYARFRKEFFVSIAGGGGGSISGGTFQPTGVVYSNAVSPTAGVSGSGLVPGILRPSQHLQLLGARLENLPGQSGSINLTPAIAAPVSGYLGTLLQNAQILIDKENIRNLERFLVLFGAFKEGGDVSQLQVDQIEQQLLQGRSTLLTDEEQYGDSLDRFRLQLGLPANLPLELDDAALRPLNRQFRRYEEVLAQFDAASQKAAELVSVEPLRPALRKLAADAPLVQGTTFQKEFPAQWAELEKSTAANLQDRNKRLRDEIRRLLDRQVEQEKLGQAAVEADKRRMAELETELILVTFEQSLRDYEAQPWKTEANPTRREQRRTTMFRIVVNDFTLVLGQPRNERLATLRTTWTIVPRLCVSGTDLLASDLEQAYAVASQTTLTDRLDLMNARGQVVDSWRQLAIFANSLLGVANIQYHWDSSTPAGVSRPLDFGGSRNRHQLILNGSPPLVRLQERNNYRASLIAYQRQRRATMEAEDLAVQAVRGEIRQLRVAAENYRIQQRQVELAYLTVENALDTFRQPPQPGVQSTQTTAAALTTQLLNAQTRLPIAQKALLTVWISYLNTRLQLYRDLELMPLDARGVWIDDIATSQCPAPADRAGATPGEASELLPESQRTPKSGTERPSE